MKQSNNYKAHIITKDKAREMAKHISNKVIDKPVMKVALKKVPKPKIVEVVEDKDGFDKFLQGEKRKLDYNKLACMYGVEALKDVMIDVHKTHPTLTKSPFWKMVKEYLKVTDVVVEDIVQKDKMIDRIELEAERRKSKVMPKPKINQTFTLTVRDGRSNIECYRRGKVIGENGNNILVQYDNGVKESFFIEDIIRGRVDIEFGEV